MGYHTANILSVSCIIMKEVRNTLGKKVISITDKEEILKKVETAKCKLKTRFKVVEVVTLMAISSVLLYIQFASDTGIVYLTRTNEFEGAYTYVDYDGLTQYVYPIDNWITWFKSVLAYRFSYKFESLTPVLLILLVIFIFITLINVIVYKRKLKKINSIDE